MTAPALLPAGTPVLRDRCRQALILAARGSSNDEIAREMYLSLHSVKSVFKEAYQALGALDRANAVALCFAHGIFDRADVFGGGR